MDILYIVGKGSKHDNIELRMSLRSICLCAKNIGKVVVAGAPPAWLSDEVVKLEVPDKYRYKHSNILNCIEQVVNQGLLDGEFLYSSDDHFYCKEVDFDNYPYYYKGALRDHAFRIDPHYKYHCSLVDTKTLCMRYGLPTVNYEQHCNTHMHTEVIKGIAEVIHEAYTMPFGAAPTSLIMNAWQMTVNPPQCVKRKDIKMLFASDISDMKRQIGDRDCFSIGDALFRNGIIEKWFGLFYKEKCRFEK